MTKRTLLLTVMKPFLLLASRPEDDAAREEREGFIRAGGIAPGELETIRMERGPLPEINLDDYSAVILGGGPFNASDPQDEKPEAQLRFEAELAPLLDEIVERDFPFFGACFGIGILGGHLDGVIDREYGEEPGAVTVRLTDEGLEDPLFSQLPAQFDGLVGHKEACSVLPPEAVLLATSQACPVQAFRVRENLYVTQFHPELDVDGVIGRVIVYRDAGYFPPEDFDRIVGNLRASNPIEPARLMRAFVQRYRR